MVESRDYTIQSAVRVCDLLDALQASEDGLRFAELVEAVKMPKSSAFRYLSTLEARGYAEQNPVTGRFQVGKRLLIGGPDRVARLMNAARPHLVAVRAATKETANLGVLSGRQVLFALVVESERERRVAARPGQLSALHSTGLGKAIASQMDPDQVRALITEPLEAMTDQTITDFDDLMAELNRVRADGYALDDRENEPGGRCVAVQLPWNDGPAAVSVSGPVDRVTMDLVPAIVDHLTACVDAIAADHPAEQATRAARSSSAAVQLNDVAPRPRPVSGGSTRGKPSRSMRRTRTTIR